MPYGRLDRKPNGIPIRLINDNTAQAFENEGAVMETRRMDPRVFPGTHRALPDRALGESGTADVDNLKSRWPKWRNVVSALTAAAVAVALNDLSALNHRAQVGLFAAAAMVTAAWGIRKLPPSARLPRYARWLFLTSAAAAMVAAALSPVPSALILAGVAVVLTASAVVLT